MTVHRAAEKNTPMQQGGNSTSTLEGETENNSGQCTSAFICSLIGGLMGLVFGSLASFRADEAIFKAQPHSLIKAVLFSIIATAVIDLVTIALGFILGDTVANIVDEEGTALARN